MAKGRELKARIKPTENTRKITRTLEMVSTSKMKRAQDRVHAARPYANALSDVISSLYTPELAEQFPLLRQPAKPRTAAVILINSRPKTDKKRNAQASRPGLQQLGIGPGSLMLRGQF